MRYHPNADEPEMNGMGSHLNEVIPNILALCERTHLTSTQG